MGHPKTSRRKNIPLITEGMTIIAVTTLSNVSESFCRNYIPSLQLSYNTGNNRYHLILTGRISIPALAVWEQYTRANMSSTMIVNAVFAISHSVGKLRQSTTQWYIHVYIYSWLPTHIKLYMYMRCQIMHCVHESMTS